MKLDTVVLFVLFCLAILGVFFFVFAKLLRRRENFAGDAGMSQSAVVTNFLREHEFLNIAELREYVNSQKYKESLDKIPESEYLTMYYSIFSEPPKDTVTWKSLVGKDEIKFEAVPYIHPNEGIEMLANRCTGPPSMSLGIKGNGSFSLFFFLVIQNLPRKKEVILQLFGNTHTNNALTVYLDGDGRIFVQFGSPGENTQLESFDKIKLKQPFLLVINKHDEKLELWEDGNIEQVTQETPDVLLSNKPMVINPSKNINFNMLAFGSCSKAMSEENLLDKYFKNQMSKTSQEFMANSKRVLDFDKELEETKKCPFDQTVCDACTEIQEWNNTNGILNRAGDKCLNALDNFCSKNVDHPHCGCWRPNSSAACQALLSSIRKEKMINPAKLTDNDVNEIKAKYNLIDQSEKENLQNEIMLMEKSNQQFRHLNAKDMRVIPEDFSTLPSYQDNEPLKKSFWSWLFG